MSKQTSNKSRNLLITTILTLQYVYSFTTNQYNALKLSPSSQNRNNIPLQEKVSSSVAEEWYEKEKEIEKTLPDTSILQQLAISDEKKKKYVVVGGGWGGWGAAKGLCEATIGNGDEDVEIILIDALPDPTGITPYLSKSGKPVEAGTRGFWKDYPNINKLCEELGLDEKSAAKLCECLRAFYFGQQAIFCAPDLLSDNF